MNIKLLRSIMIHWQVFLIRSVMKELLKQLGLGAAAPSSQAQELSMMPDDGLSPAEGRRLQQSTITLPSAWVKA